jgi:integrase
MAYIEERTDTKGRKRYRVQIKLKGFPAQNATFERKTDAKEWAKRTESAIKEGRHFKTMESKKHTVKEMIERYKKNVLPNKGSHKSNQKIQLNYWIEQIGDYTLADATPALIAECRDELLNGITRLKKKRSPATVNRYIAALSHCFTIAMKEWGWVEDNPLRKVTKPKEARGRVRFLSDDERKTLLKVCKESSNPLLYPIVVIALSTGARLGEILSIKFNQVDLERGTITFFETKNGEIRVVPLVAHALDVVKEMSKVRRIDTDLLFPSNNPQKPIDIRHPWKEALKKSGIKNYRFHDNRHSAASYLAMSGATLTEIADVLGHKTLQMVKRYSHLSEQHTSKIVTKMNKQIFK